MSLNPAPDRLVLEIIEQRQESAHGIVLSQKNSGESPQGRLIEIGHDARLRLEGLQVGDTVFFAPGQGGLVADSGVSRVIVHVNDVLAWTKSQ